MDTQAQVKLFEVHTRKNHCYCFCYGSNRLCLWRPLAKTMGTFMSNSRNCIDYHERSVTGSSSHSQIKTNELVLKGWREAEQIRPEDFHCLLPHWTAPGCILWGEFRNGLDAGANTQQKTEAHPEDMGACNGGWQTLAASQAWPLPQQRLKS